MAVVNGYVTVDQVRAELADDGDQLPLALLEKAINATARAVDNWCGRRFWQDSAAVVRRYRPCDRDRVEVDDISTTAGLLVATDDAGDGTYSTAWTLDSDFELEPENANADGGAYAWWELVAIGSRYFSRYSRRRSLQVTARWGWSAVPDPVMEATLLRAVSIFKRKESPHGVASFGEFGPIRITRKDPDVIDLLTPYQKPMAG